MKSRKIVAVKEFSGVPKLSDFQIIEENVRETLEDGEILCQAEYLSVDPYMRNKAIPGEAMLGMQVARVLESRLIDYPVGSQIVANFGWVERTIFKPLPTHGVETIYKMPDMKGLSDSYALGTVGRPGNTAFFGLLRVLEPKQGETVVISAAAGAVGSLVGQIAKIKGCKVLGFAGADDKVQWLKDDLGFDFAFNYKKVNVPEIFSQHAPEGIDKYFDNVGGEFANHVVKHMKPFGKIGMCGAISVYNAEKSHGSPLVPLDYGSIIYKNLKLEGLHVLRWKDEWFTGLNQIRDWILEGKIKVRETVTNGFEHTPSAFIEMLTGINHGKAVVKV